MYFFKAGVAVILTLLMIMLNCTTVIASSVTNDQNEKITVHEPKSRTSATKDFPGKGGNTWLWVLLGVAVVAGGAAALAGSGSDSGGSGGSSDSPTAETGSISGSW